MLFKDKFGSAVLIKYEYIVNVEEIAAENLSKVFNNETSLEKKFHQEKSEAS
jgi:hypothetical protein